ncbi:flagellar hook-associated protein FlgL [uncultured Amphritea sp.]|uniref:flagellar hook-associated protein FlgL n=1 Tax=uncultured Amphritea sp. TaxID=981605 RepID=UPI0026031ADF|nr:flagellar hook-associated protein FlgL [uncultured Amphritea sp.]
MRISTQQQYLQSMQSMQQGQTRLAELQEQISSGKRVVRPSDDPVAAAQAIKLERELAQSEKYDENINVTQRRLELEETILSDINVAVDRMRELTVQAGNGTLGDQDRASIGNELYQLKDYVAGLMNTKDSQGEYLFAGSKGLTKPYIESGDGSYSFTGDDGQRVIQVGSDLFVPSNDSGQYLFESIEGPLQVNLTGQAVYNADLASTDPFMRNVAFANTSAEDQFKLATQGLGDLTISVTEASPGAFVYSIEDSGGNPVIDDNGDPITDIPAGDLSTTPLALNLFGMQFDLTAPADPAANEITINTYTETKNILDVAVELADVLVKPVKGTDGQAALNKAIASGLTQFEEGAERMLQATSVLGSRLKTLENVSSSNLDFQLLTQTTLSTLVDADLAQVISEFKLQEATLQASQATFARVSSLSLFNYIN